MFQILIISGENLGGKQSPQSPLAQFANLSHVKVIIFGNMF